MPKLVLEMTCSACPEQYDVFLDDKDVGYLRLRHGRFTVDCPFGNTIRTAFPEGDGCFDSDERMEYLEMAVNSIWSELNLEGKPQWTFK